MYSVVNKYFSDSAPYDGLLPHNNTFREYRRRMDVIRNFIIELGLKAGIEQEKLNKLRVCEGLPASDLFIHLKGREFAAVASELGDAYFIRIPATLIYNFEKDINDLKKDNTHENLMQKIDDLEWVKENIFKPFLKQEELEFSDAELLRDNCRILIRDVNENPEKIFNMLRFSILHELGHINNGDSVISDRSFLRFSKFCLVASLISIVGLQYFIATSDRSVITRIFLGGISLREIARRILKLVDK